MTTIDDSNTTPASTPPGYWFGEIESRLHDRLRDALAEQDLRRGGWRILHSLADAPATAAELADRMPRGRRGGRGGDNHDHFDGGHERAHDRGSADGDRGDWGHDRNHSDHDHRNGGHDHPPHHHPHTDPDRIHRPDLHGERDHQGRDFTPREFRGHRPAGYVPGPGAWSYSRETWQSDGAGAPEHCRHPHQHPHDEASHDAHRGHSSEHREAAFERGFERGFRRGVASAVGGQAGAGGPFGGPFGPGFGPGFGPHRGHDRHPGHYGRPGRGHGHRRHVDITDRRIRRVERILADFTERGWVWFDGDRATLTDEGRAAHDAAFARVREVRAALAAGIPADDYATTLATLEAMARNLGWEPAEQPADEQAAGEDRSQAADQEPPAAPDTETSPSAEG